MVSVKFDVAGLVTHKRAEAARFVQVASLAGENEMKKTILGPSPTRTGRKYKRGAKTHTASAPGESPAIDTGRLRQSTASHPVQFEGNKVSAATGVATEYAQALELGTERIAPRPHISRLATDKSIRDRIIKTAASAIRD